MPRTSSFVTVELEAGEEPLPLMRPESDTPFRILLMGDFSGRAGRGDADARLAGRRPILVDRDNFEAVMARLNPDLGPIAFSELDDFHPDQLYARLPVFAALRDTRERLLDRTTFQAAAKEVRAWSGAPDPSALPEDAERLSPEQLLARMLDEVEPAPARPVDEFDVLVRRIVAPYTEPKPDPRQADLVAQVDEAIAAQMRALLHHPEFQALEAAWRGLFFLVRRLDTDVNLKLYLLDLTGEELRACLCGAEDVRETALYGLVVEQSVGTPGAEPWALLAGDFTFDGRVGDADVLRRLGEIARYAGAPFLAAAGARLLASASPADAELAEAWQAFRRSPGAGWTGLALPRFLLRLPYGKKTSPAEHFDFEEMPGVPHHPDYLWSNPVFACVALLGEGFSRQGWDLRPNTCRELDGLPLHVWREDGEARLTPCAETLLTEAAMEAILDQGLMPLVAIKDTDRILLPRFQSVAEPPAALPGRWI